MWSHTVRVSDSGEFAALTAAAAAAAEQSTWRHVTVG